MDALAAALLANHGMHCKVDALRDLAEDAVCDMHDTAAVAEELKYRDIAEWGQQVMEKDVEKWVNGNIKGKHVLQVQRVRDITQPKRQTGDGEAETDEWGVTKNVRGSRLLKMKLSDGVGGCTAVELTTQPHIRDIPMPGSKVLIQDIPIRAGYCIIKPDTLIPIGGGVDELEQEFQLEQVSAATGGKRVRSDAPPFIPFGKKGAEALVADRPEAIQPEEDENEEKQRRVVDVQAADYRRAMGAAKDKPAGGGGAPAADEGGKGGKGSRKGVCADYGLGKCTRGQMCRFIHEDHGRKWPGKDGHKKDKGDAAAATAGAAKAAEKKKNIFDDEPIVVRANPTPAPVAKKEARKVEVPSEMLQQFSVLKKDDDEMDMFGNKLKDKKKKEEKDQPAAKSPPAAPAAPKQLKMWNCRRCTAENYDVSTECCVCGTERRAGAEVLGSGAAQPTAAKLHGVAAPVEDLGFRYGAAAPEEEYVNARSFGGGGGYGGGGGGGKHGGGGKGGKGGKSGGSSGKHGGGGGGGKHGGGGGKGSGGGGKGGGHDHHHHGGSKGSGGKGSGAKGGGGKHSGGGGGHGPGVIHHGASSSGRGGGGGSGGPRAGGGGSSGARGGGSSGRGSGGRGGGRGGK